ncbi:hypothetical protein Afil01_63060 [Actinorhabdospora filicis]|uniref:Uncharacterized protein n=1 Tax=Actinorhabdospora filicis TaxID=1785913 RepID=A0A9W6WCC3_9ACTN|nr:hypothetical protein Afil01_63060 [Actinorhabdospora filicis]
MRISPGGPIGRPTNLIGADANAEPKVDMDIAMDMVPTVSQRLTTPPLMTPHQDAPVTNGS